VRTMDQIGIRRTLQALAHYVVRNEIVCEHFLTHPLPVKPGGNWGKGA
jgi:hypothetical protein